MRRKKFLAVVLPALLIVIAGCGPSSTGGGTTSVLGGSPPPPTTLDARQTALCLGHTIGNFANLGEQSDENIVVRVLEDAFETVFEQSCLQTIKTGLTLIQQKVDPTTYLYVGPVKEEQSQAVWDNTPIDVANCTSFPTSSSFNLGPPLWISVADLTTGTAQDRVFQAVDFPFQSTVPGDVATYLDSTYNLGFHAFFDKQPISSSQYPTLPPDGYVEIDPGIVVVTFKTGLYAVYSGGSVTYTAQWSYLWDLSFLPSTFHWTYHASGANANGLCTPA
jgi:hypothetical protein